MKKLLVVFSLSAVLFSLLPSGYGEDTPKDWIEYDTDKIIQTDPSTISEEQFYGYEQALMRGFSGSGGYFLEQAQIEWLQKAVANLQAKGINPKDEYARGAVYGDSYFHLNEYRKSIEEYRKVGEAGGAEEVEWFLNNKGIKNGALKIAEYSGKIPYTATEEARVEDSQYLFVAYFKGPVYRYDKSRDTHAVIFAPEDRYDWVDSLKWDGKRLIIKCRNIGKPG